MSRIALITGVDGQDGYYLSRFLLAKGYAVTGTILPAEIARGNIAAEVTVTEADLRIPGVLARLIDQTQPSEIYHLAAPNFSSADARNARTPFEIFIQVNALATGEGLEAIRTRVPAARLFYASSCHVFGSPQVTPQDERTPVRPENLYAISKACGAALCRYFRENSNVFAAVGILFNHESPRRNETYITAQLARAAARVALGRTERVVVRDLTATVDWGAAQDYVEAMWLTLQATTPDDFVIATGQPHTVQDFAVEAFSSVGADWTRSVESASSGVRAGQSYLGNPQKIHSVTGWKPRTSFSELVVSMVDFWLDHEKNLS